MRILIFVLAIFGTAAMLWQVSRSKTYQLFGELIISGPSDQKKVALTFDDGPHAVGTMEILEALEQAGVTATFYLVGKEIIANPELSKAIVDQGHEIGNHSYAHNRLVLKTPNTIRSSLNRTDAAIRAIGYEGPITFRSPYGRKLFVLPWVLKQMERANIMWDVDPIKALGQDATAEQITKHVADNAQNGSIILLHGMFRSNHATRAALPDIIEALHQKGLELVTISELLGRD